MPDVSHRAVAVRIAQQLRDGESVDTTLALTGILHALLALREIETALTDIANRDVDPV